MLVLLIDGLFRGFRSSRFRIRRFGALLWLDQHFDAFLGLRTAGFDIVVLGVDANQLALDRVARVIEARRPAQFQ